VPWFYRLKKTLLASWMEGHAVEEGRHHLSKAGLPYFEYPDDAAWSFAAMWRREVMMNMFRSPPRWRPCPSRVEVEASIARAKEILYKDAKLYKVEIPTCLGIQSRV
jgi:acyl-CoA synthetase (NDP forming)